MSFPNDAQSFQQAVALAQAGQREQAHLMLSRMLQSNPNDPNTLLWHGYTAPDLNTARTSIGRVEGMYPNYPPLAEARQWLANAERQVQPVPQSSYNAQPGPANQYGQGQGQGGYQAQPYVQPGYQAQAGYNPQPNYQYQNPQPGYGPQGSYASGPQVTYAPKPGFFDRLSLGWQFLKQTFAMASLDRNLLKPSFYSLGVNLLVSIILAIPLFLIYRVSNSNTVMYISLFLVAVVNYFITYYFSAMTIHLVYQHLTTGRTSMADAGAASKRKAGELLLVAAISAFISTIRSFFSRGDKGVWGVVAGIVLGIIQAIWTAYTYFILPVIMIEDLQVGAAVKRSTQIIKNNLLLVGVGYVGLGLVIGLLGFAFFMVTLVISIAIFLVLFTLSTILAFILALVFFIAALAVMSAFTSYVRTAYYTCLVLWAKDVERMGASAQAPAPLRTVLAPRQIAA